MGIDKKIIVIWTPIVMKVCMFTRKITKQYYIMRIMPVTYNKLLQLNQQEVWLLYVVEEGCLDSSTDKQEM